VPLRAVVLAVVWLCGEGEVRRRCNVEGDKVEVIGIVLWVDARGKTSGKGKSKRTHSPSLVICGVRPHLAMRTW
jgi:hypothetical protein